MPTSPRLTRRWRDVSGPYLGLGLALAGALATFAPPVFARAAPRAATEATPSERTWVTHTILYGESYDDIAQRYGVTKKEILRWNKKRLGEKKWLIAGRKLRIYARRVPPPRERVTYVVQKGDTFQKIADRFGVRAEQLRHWNRRARGKGKKLYVGSTLTVWADPKPETTTVSAPAQGQIPEFRVRAGGFARGAPNRGRLMGGVQLPESDDYTIRNPERSYGTSHAVLQIQRALADFRLRSGYRGEILIADMSRKGGGRLRPHRSHQTGRDADIRLPKLSGIPRGKSPTMDEIDWRAAWHLIAAFVDTGEVEYIFLDYRRQRRLYKAARALGVSTERLRAVMQYPDGPHARHGIVRHAKGHTIHIHVRIKCAPDDVTCKTY